jgi:signal transduction histidine kinase
MSRHPLTSWTVKRLRFVLLVFFLLLVIPTAILITYTYSQLKWESFHRERVLAEELVKRIDRRFGELIAEENARPFTDYSFLNVTGTATANQLQRSPLSQFPVKQTVKGTLGYFQIDPNGKMSTPILPTDNQDQRLSAELLSDLGKRIAQRDVMLNILSQNQLITPKPAAPPSVARANEPRNSSKPRTDELSIASTSADEEGNAYTPQALFEQLKSKNEAADASQPKQSLGRLEDLKLSKQFRTEPQAESKAKEKPRKIVSAKKDASLLRKEQNVLPERQGLSMDSGQVSHPAGSVKINMFESEIDAFDFSVLDSGHFVLFRKVWKDGQRLIQGILFEPNAFIDGIIQPMFNEATVSRSSDLTVGYEGNILSVLHGRSARTYISRASDIKGFLLLEGRLADPFSGITLVFSVNQLPAGPGATVVNWLAVLLILILCCGFYLMYRLGVRQIRVARQQQDFISAVSHELKTPLTSIRMYGEMLMQGWLAEDKRKQYYTYIHDESERLTRLINNVLQMARMTRNDIQLDMKSYTVEQLLDTIRSKVSSQIERAGFTLSLQCEQQCESRSINLDIDYFIQIIINIVDNAIKFSAKAQTKQIDITCLPAGKNKIQWRLRDYGPGIPKQQMRKIFELFYRSESELTRETIGTGIGLALVTELTQAMKGSIDVVNHTPGVQFQLTFPMNPPSGRNPR